MSPPSDSDQKTPSGELPDAGQRPADLEAKLEHFAKAVRAGAEPADAFVESGFEWTREATHWPGLYDDETSAAMAMQNENAEACYREFEELAGAHKSASSGELTREEALDRMLTAAVRSLGAYASVGNWPLEAGPLAALPRGIALLAESLIGDLTRGRIPEPLRTLYFAKGLNSKNSGEIWAIRVAMLYYWYCDTKKVSGATERISEKFGVTRQAVDKWRRSIYPDNDLLAFYFSLGDDGMKPLEDSLSRAGELYRKLNRLPTPKAT